MLLTLYDNKTIHRNREKKEEAERALAKEQDSRNTENEGCWDKTKTFFTDLLSTIMLKVKYLIIPMVKVLPSVMFRLGTLWLLLTYSTEWYLNATGDGPGLGLFLPLILMIIIMGAN